MDIIERYVVHHASTFLDHISGPYVQEAESQLLQTLRTEQIFDGTSLIRIIERLFVPLLPVLLMSLLALISILAFIISVGKTLCSRNNKLNSNRSFSSCCATVTISAITVFGAIFAFGVVVTTPFYLSLDKKVHAKFELTNRAFGALQNGIEQFKTDVDTANSIVTDAEHIATDSLHVLPFQIYKKIVKNVHKKTETLKSKFAKEIREPLVLKSCVWLENWMKQFDGFKNEIKNLNDTGGTFEKNINILKDFVSRTNAHEQFGEWLEICELTRATYDPLLKQLEFSKRIQRAIMKSIEKYLNSTNNTSVSTSPLFRDLKATAEKLYPPYYRSFSARLRLRLTKLEKFKCNRWFVICMCCHGLPLCAALAFGLGAMGNGARSAQSAPIRVGRRLRKNRTPRRYRNFAMVYGTLAVGYALSVACLAYLSRVARDVVCAPLNDGAIFHRHFDDVQVWSGQSWLDKNLGPWAQNYTLKGVVEACKSQTVYGAFRIEEYWDIQNFFRNLKFTLENEKLHGVIQNAVKSVNLPNGETLNAVNRNIAFIKNEYNITKLQVNINHTISQISTIKNMLNNLHKDIKKNKKEVNQNVTDANYTNANYRDFKKVQNEFETLEKTLVNNSVGLEWSGPASGGFLKRIEAFEKLVVETEEVFQKLSETVENNLNNTITEKLQALEKATQLQISTIRSKLIDNIKRSYGNCSFLPFTFDTLKQDVCKPTLDFDTVWLTLVLNAALMSMLLALYSSIYSTFLNYCEHQLKQRTASNTAAESKAKSRLKKGTLLFDRSGKFMGNSVRLVHSSATTSKTEET